MESRDKLSDTEWEKAAQAKQTESERELERLNSEARKKFNDEQAALRQQQQTLPEQEIIENPSLF